jgi:hypothetical protein
VGPSHAVRIPLWEWLAAAALAGLLAADPGAAQPQPAQGPDPVRAQQLRQAKLDAGRLEEIRERVHALALEVQQQEAPPPEERSLVGRVHAIRGSTLYVRSGAAVVPLTVQASTRVIGRARPLGRPATPAARLRRQLQEGEEVRARFTVTPAAPGRAAQNLVTTLQATPVPGPAVEPRPAAPPAKSPAR